MWVFCVRTVGDTQCGYKLFSRSAAQKILPNLHIQRWAFDVELLFIAESMCIAYNIGNLQGSYVTGHYKCILGYGMKISEVAIKWEEIEGTKMVPVLSWIQMARDLVMIWLRYTTYYWKIHKSL